MARTSRTENPIVLKQPIRLPNTTLERMVNLRDYLVSTPDAALLAQHGLTSKRTNMGVRISDAQGQSGMLYENGQFYCNQVPTRCAELVASIEALSRTVVNLR